MTERYPYRQHGPAVHGSKLADFLISEANMIEDGLLYDFLRDERESKAMKLAHTRPDVDFDTAFVAAREAGADLFEWRGKRYTTQRDDDPKPDGDPVVTKVEYVRSNHTSAPVLESNDPS